MEVAAAVKFGAVSGVRGQAKRDTALFAEDNERSEAASALVHGVFGEERGRKATGQGPEVRPR